MTYRLIIRTEAETDMTKAAAWYQNERAGLGVEFLVEIDESLARALSNPHQYQRLRRTPDVRRILTRRFPFRIFFLLQADAVVVFRVLHTAQHDREWKRKIPET